MKGARSRPVGFGNRAWFQRVGEASLTLGTPRFHEALLDLCGSLVGHDASWIIRFSVVAPPAVMYTKGVPAHIVEHYQAACASIDPFAAYWRYSRKVGVRALSQFRDTLNVVDAGPYNQIFAPAANVSDELGLFLSTIGHSSLGLFLEREVGEFHEEELQRVGSAFPILNGLHRAHIGRLFDRLRYAGSAAEPVEITRLPTLVQDRHNIPIFSSPSWQAAVTNDPDIEEIISNVVDEHHVVLRNYVMNVERFDEYFPLAPGGRMFTLFQHSRNAYEHAAAKERAKLRTRLTPREKDVFALIISGGSTSSISRILCLTKSTVKNYKVKIYKKAGVDSERNLIQKYGIKM